MGLEGRSFGTSLWLGLKWFKSSWSRVRLAFAILSLLTANFTIVSFTLFPGGEILPIASIIVIMAVAFAAIMLHLVKLSAQDLGLLKALGAKRGTLTFAVLIELTLLGLTSAFLGLAAGLLTLILLEGLTVFRIFILQILYLEVASAIAGSLTGAFFVWRYSRKTVAEILANAG